MRVTCTASGKMRPAATRVDWDGNWDDEIICCDCGGTAVVWVRMADLAPRAKIRAHKAPEGVCHRPRSGSGRLVMSRLRRSVLDIATRRVYAWVTPTERITPMDTESIECLNGPTECAGPVEYRYPLSGTGRSFPRCEKHWEERLIVQEGIDQRYPSMQPADFDPLYAGESWYEDE